MYLIRRVFRCKPGTARRAAEQITKIGKAYENAGQRSPIRVYTSGGTVPGPANTVYMDWTAPVLESPYREGNPMPEEIRPVSQQMNEHGRGEDKLHATVSRRPMSHVRTPAIAGVSRVYTGPGYLKLRSIRMGNIKGGAGRSGGTRSPRRRHQDGARFPRVPGAPKV